MEISATNYIHGAQGLQGPHRKDVTAEVASTESRNNTVKDDLRLSDEAMKVELSDRTEASSSGIRFELVNRIKAEIAAGTYDTPDKMDIAMDRLLAGMGAR